ncbi:NAD(P)/FAD-dependent oxidoreductase [Myxococcota bacterium]|nr:NAD(P)/FAD-dependent oxidoreductase [Myxococcota bacterium]
MEAATAHHRIVIIGAGPGGLCTAIRLKQEGIEDFVVLEKASGVGGTWWHNRYPGAACDVRSHLYSFSFEPKVDWTRPYANQPEILAYLEHCAEKYALAPHLRFETPVQAADWDDTRCRWTLRTKAGETLEADILISAVGMFNELNYPKIEGLDRFAGKAFHSARWDPDWDLTGRRVGVIGSAASAVQFIPELTAQAGQVYLHQRTANWVLPKDDVPYTAEQLREFAKDPKAVPNSRETIWDEIDVLITFSDESRLEAAARAGLRNLEVVEDPELRSKLMPEGPYGCKRPLMSNDYYPAFNRDNLELVTEPISHLTADSIVTADGTTRKVDTLILATGFETTRFLSAIEVTGREGRRLSEAWNDGAQAYLGVSTAGFPNLFMLYGPNTNNGSILYMIECQVDFALKQIQRLENEGLAWIDVKPEPMESFNAEIQRDINGVTVWQAGCNDYYRSPSGRVVTQWPHSMGEYRDRIESLDPQHFHGAKLSKRTSPETR